MKLNRLLALVLATKQSLLLGRALALLFAGLILLNILLLPVRWWNDIKLSSLSGIDTQAPSDLSAMDELLKLISKAHLFGYHSSLSSNAPITSAELRLMGIIQIDEEQESLSKAIIAVQGNIGKIYQVGELLSEGVKLSAIHPDAVLLDNNGHMERLPLQRPKLENRDAAHD